MKVQTMQNLEFTTLERENLSICMVDKTENYDVVLAKIQPKQTMRLHRHKRPKNGDEIFLFHKGGFFRVRTDREVREFHTTDPILLRFMSSEPHSVINLSDDELHFFAFYMPPFKEGEVELVE